MFTRSLLPACTFEPLSARRPLKWKNAGAWPSSKKVKNSFSFAVPAGDPTSVTIQLPVTSIKSWLKPGDKASFGVLLKMAVSEAGYVDVITSLNSDEAARPQLRLTWSN